MNEDKLKFVLKITKTKNSIPIRFSINQIRLFKFNKI